MNYHNNIIIIKIIMNYHLQKRHLEISDKNLRINKDCRKSLYHKNEA